jgi:hypothetical protein
VARQPTSRRLRRPGIRAPSWRRLPFRKLLRDSFDLALRPLPPSIDTLTIRRDDEDASFILHRRDAARVTVAGGMYHIMPAGVFQPSSLLPAL